MHSIWIIVQSKVKGQKNSVFLEMSLYSAHLTGFWLEVRMIVGVA